ncbi:hypothetical protein AYK20_08735 [Thermoplasmatales archaeon SG8-52-1]|nr:MAG: hypothetical protein AYK20_08735 [Thermoplasmatales archaeon SG8-52-1]
MKNHLLAVGITILFILSIISPIVFGHNINISNKEKSIPSTQSNDGPMDSAWPMFCLDTHHTGRSQYGKSGPWYREKWNIKLDSWCDSSPVIDENGTIYIGSSWYLFAINSNGTLKWKYKTWGNIDNAPAINEDGTIYAGSNEGYLYAFYPNGTKKWKTSNGGWSSSPVIDENGTIFFGSSNGRIYAVNPNGTKKWSYKTDGFIACSPVIDNDTLYCGSHDTHVYAIYKNNGTLKWKYNSADWIWGLSIADDGTVYFTNCAGYLIALYTNGTRKWRRDLGLSASGSPAIAEDGSIYVAVSHDSWIYRSDIFCINPNGNTKWRYDYYTEHIHTSPAIDKYGIIYFGTCDGWLLALNPDGTLRWSFKTLDFIHSSPAIGEDGTIYISSTFTSEPDFYSYLYALEPVEGNSPPQKPIIEGPRKIRYYKEYTYMATSVDPDGDNISYFFDWDDDSNSGWTEFVPSGLSINRSHSWKYTGSDVFTIRVKTKDEHGAWSDWCRLNIKMPRIKALSNSQFFRFLEQYPLIQKVLLYFIK